MRTRHDVLCCMGDDIDKNIPRDRVLSPVWCTFSLGILYFIISLKKIRKLSDRLIGVMTLTKEKTMRRGLIAVCIMAMAVGFYSLAGAATYPIDQGVWFGMGSLDIASLSGEAYENEDGDGKFNFYLEDTGGYFIMPNLAIGGKVLIDYTSWGDYKETVWGIGPFIAYFFGGAPAEVKGSYYPYVGGTFLYASSTTEYPNPIDQGTTEIESTMTKLGVFGGVVYMLTKTVGIFGEVGFSMDSIDPDEGDSEDGNRIGIKAGVSAFLY